MTAPADATGRRDAVAVTAAALTAALHAVAFWGPVRSLALFLAGIAVAAPAEAVGVRLGLLDHRLRPRILGVPVPVVLAWPAAVYAASRLVAAAGGPVVLVPVVAAVANAAFEPLAVRRGLWRYPLHPLSRPRLAGVPWWNGAAWVALTGATLSGGRLLYDLVV